MQTLLKIGLLAKGRYPPLFPSPCGWLGGYTPDFVAIKSRKNMAHANLAETWAPDLRVYIERPDQA